jgi:RimJ/RimL family protein N-acetyltransferase
MGRAARDSEKNTSMTNALRLTTTRLELVSATATTVRAAANGDLAELGRVLAADVATDWPPEFVSDALPPLANALGASEPQDGYSMWFILLRQPRTLIGTVSYKGPPSDGRIDIGYSVVASHQRKGYATEAARTLVHRAMADSAVDRVVAETYPELTPSVRVLEKCGFEQCAADVTGFSGELGVVQFQLTRQRWRAAQGDST